MTSSFISKVAVGLLLGSSVAAAATLYAAPDGSDQSSCDKGSPCTLLGAISEAGDGDTIELAGGEYTGNFVLATPGLTLTAADESDRPVIIAADTANDNNQNVPLLLAQTGITVFHIDIVLGPLEEDLGQRDLGVFVTPDASDATLSYLTVHRDESRLGMELDPAVGPGSRGVLVFIADGVTVEGCEVTGPWQDGIHLPSVNTQVYDCMVSDSTRVGIVTIQEFPDSDNSGHTIKGCDVRSFAVDGIQIQTDDTLVMGCTVSNDMQAMYGIHVCAPGLVDDSGMPAICVPPVSMPGRNDVAERVTLMGNTVDPANLQQAIVAPADTSIVGAGIEGDVGSYGAYGAYGDMM